MIEIPLIGAGGEPVDFRATINSHGVASLPPAQPDADLASRLRITLRLDDGAVRTVDLFEASPGVAGVDIISAAATDARQVERAIRHILRLDQDLSGFYALTAIDPLLDWVNVGFGRMMRCQTVFEDVIKTLLTTNCAWSATIRMNERIIGELGERDPGYEVEAPLGRAFPLAATMAEGDETFYREVIRAGYRAPHIVKLANRVASGDLELEALGRVDRAALADDDLEKELLALPGIGPYAAAHIMHMLGRSSRLVFDSWTRPAYARIAGVESINDKEIVARFARYEEHAGLAYWMVVTRPWFEEHGST